MRLLPVLLALMACAPTDPDTSPDTDATVVRADDRPNPLVPEIGLFPWPSDQYLVPDDTTVTGRRLSLPDAHVPDGLAADMFAAEDGFSRVVPILAYLPGGVSPSSLPDPEAWDATLQDDSPVMLVRIDTGERVPLLAENDATEPDPTLATLVLRPHRALAANTRYAVLLRTSLTTVDGVPHQARGDFADLLAGTGRDDRAVQAVAPDVAAAVAAAGAQGIPPEELALAWTFHTRSAEQVTGPALSMQDQAMDAPSDGYTLDAPIEEADRVLIYGTLTTPNFLDATQHFVLDEEGAPIQQGTMQAPFLITIPKTVTQTRPAVLFGHGFFSAIEEPTWGNLFDGLARWQMAAVTTKFFGFAEEDLLGSAAALGGDRIELDTIITQQLQSHVNFTMVHRMLTEHLADTLELGEGEAAFRPLDATNVPYMGISNGGTQGLVLMTTSPVLDRGGLVVAGGGWTHMLQRAAQWSTLGVVFSSRYQDGRNMQLAMSLLQQTFDPVDSLNYIDHLITDRHPGRAPNPDLLLVEAVNDSQVSNLVSRWVAGNAGFPLLTPSVADVWGLDALASPTEEDDARVGYEIYDLGVPDNPSGNVAPVENGVHADVRLLDAYREQMGIFLETGRVVRTCEGACDPE